MSEAGAEANSHTLPEFSRIIQWLLQLKENGGSIITYSSLLSHCCHCHDDDDDADNGKDSGYEGNKSLLFVSIIFCDKDSF